MCVCVRVVPMPGGGPALYRKLIYITRSIHIYFSHHFFICGGSRAPVPLYLRPYICHRTVGHCVFHKAVTTRSAREGLVKIRCF